MTKPPTLFPKTAFVVSHTHWDREWYQGFHEFRVDLVRVVDEVLDRLETDDAFRHFVLDGQAIVLEDYLELVPETGDRLRRLVGEGGLSVGPWYVLPDEFLVGGESTVRNLLLGHQVAETIGRPQKVGYMPDSFGHIAQMPQILKKSGIDSFVYTRGHGEEIEELGLEYRWRAPDGSEVLALHQEGGYCNAGGLGHEELWHAHTPREIDLDRAVEQVRELFEKIGRRANGDLCLLNNGCDHFPPQRELGTILERLRREFPETEFRHAGFSEFVEAVRSAGIARRSYEGELRWGKDHLILSGVWSARMPLKQQNDLCQTRISGYLEPLSAAAHFLHGQPYPSGAIRYAWKELLKNHPHDSICGCSTDEVHRDMEPRFRAVLQTAGQEMRRQLQTLLPTFGPQAKRDRDTVLCVANPIPQARTEVIRRMVVLQPFEYDLDRMVLLDEEGKKVPFWMVERQYVERFWGIDYRRELFAEDQEERFAVYVERFGDRILRDESRKSESDCFLTLEFLAELPPVGHAHFLLIEEPDRPEAGSSDRRGSTSPHPPFTDPVTCEIGSDRVTLENACLRATLHSNGAIDLTNKESGREFRGLNLLEDTEDVGDEYDYCPCRSSETDTSGSIEGRLELRQSSPLRAWAEASFDWMLPRSIRPDRQARSEDRTPCRVRSRITLESGGRFVSITTWFDNRVKDHRLRAVFPTAIQTRTLVSDGHFYRNHRPVEDPAAEGWAQPPTATHPQQEYSFVEDGAGGLAVFNRGLPEIAVETGDEGGAVLRLTLLRCVEWLSRDDLPTRGCANAGPTLYTPEAQCLGEHRFDYAVAPFEGNPVEADLHGMSRRYHTPPLCVQGVDDGKVAGGRGLLEIRSRRTEVTAIKRAETRDSLIVRLYNLTGGAVNEVLSTGAEIEGAWVTSLLEERLARLEAGTREVAVELGPYEIVTVELALRGPVGG